MQEHSSLRRDPAPVRMRTQILGDGTRADRHEHSVTVRWRGEEPEPVRGSTMTGNHATLHHSAGPTGLSERRTCRHGPMPPTRVIEYRTMKPGSDPSGIGT